MQLANIAARLMKPFANSGNKAAIPQTGTDPARASYETGFTPLNMTPIAAGGVPPSGRDMNGILYDLSNAMMWQQAMGILPYDATVSYPNGALVVYGGMMWKCLADDTLNVTPVNGAKWTSDIHTGYVKKTGDTMTGPLTIPNGTASGHAVNLGQFGKLLSASGYQKLPSGLIIQWQNISISTADGVFARLNFPIAFPNGHLASSYLDKGTAAEVIYAYKLLPVSTTQFDLARKAVLSTLGTTNACMIHIGY